MKGAYGRLCEACLQTKPYDSIRRAQDPTLTEPVDLKLVMAHGESIN